MSEVQRTTVRQLCFVMCPSFSGATLLALLLNNHSELSSLGDAIPTRVFDQVCACGKNVSQCEFWKEVRSRLRSERFAEEISLIPAFPRFLPGVRGNHCVAALLRAIEGHASIPGLRPGRRPVVRGLLFRAVDRALHLAPAARMAYLETQLAFYAVVRELQGARYFVDGSKSPLKAALLARYVGPEVSVRVIHLTRDPRGFYCSWLSNVGQATPRAIARRWAAQHAGIEALSSVAPNVRTQTVRYEDLCVNPDSAMDKIFSFLGVAQENVVGPPRYPAKHHLMGNKMLCSFNGSIHLDTQWNSRLSRAQQDLVLRSAGGAVERYGYWLD